MATNFSGYKMSYSAVEKKYIFGGGAFVSFLLILGIALLPVYTFSSGGIQPAHAILALFAITTLQARGIPLLSWVLFLAAISFYAFFIESFYSIIGINYSSIINSIFLFYNFIVVVSVFSYCRNYGISALVPGIIVACIIAAISIVITATSFNSVYQERSTGLFNNPNQLGYFSVCILSLTYLLYRHGNFNFFFTIILFFFAIALSITSLSKAAMVANFFVIFLALKPVSATNKKFLGIRAFFFWALLILFLLTTLYVFYAQGFFDDFRFVQRLQSITHEDDSSLESRGYFAFLEGSSLQIIFGLGGYNVADIVGHEVHSTLASIMNNYGIVGFLLFSGALVVWALKLWQAYGFIGMFCLTGPAMLYGITHNGTRFTLFWVLFGASMAMADDIIYNRKLKKTSSR